jgi:hypothetical protein
MSVSNYHQMGEWPRLPDSPDQPHSFTAEQLVIKTEKVAFHDYWWAGIVIPHAIAQCFFTLADLLILQRVVSNVLEAQPDSVKTRVRRLSAAVLVLFSLLNLVNVASMIACGVVNIQAGHEFLRSSALYRSGDNTTAAKMLHAANDFNDQSNQIQGVRCFQTHVLCTYLCVIVFAGRADFRSGQYGFHRPRVFPRWYLCVAHASPGADYTK